MKKSVSISSPGMMLCGAGWVHAQTAWQPERALEVIVGSSPGTGTDRTARLIQKIWQEQKSVPVTVISKPGLAKMPEQELRI